MFILDLYYDFALHSENCNNSLTKLLNKTKVYFSYI